MQYSQNAYPFSFYNQIPVEFRLKIMGFFSIRNYIYSEKTMTVHRLYKQFEIRILFEPVIMLGSTLYFPMVLRPSAYHSVSSLFTGFVYLNKKVTSM